MHTLQIDCEAVRRILTGFIDKEVRKAGFARVVLGLSGGVDSALAAYLAAEALGPENVTALVMPYRASNPESASHADLVIKALVNGLDDDREVLRHRYPVLEQEYALRALESDQLVAAVDLIESLGGGYHNPDIAKRPKQNPS